MRPSSAPVNVIIGSIGFMWSRVVETRSGSWTLHGHRGQADVAVDLESGDLLEGRETMLEDVRLHPVDYDPEGLVLATDDQLKEQKVRL